MDRAPELQLVLESLFDNSEYEPHVYFQPPPNTEMHYPCIRFERSRGETQFADNLPYRFVQQYSITVIDEDPNSELREAMTKLPMTVHTRFYVANGLNHDVFNTYF